MKCPHCGKNLADGARFCAYCGNPVHSMPPVQNNASQPQNPTSFTPPPQQLQQRPPYVPPQQYYNIPGLTAQKPRYMNLIALIAAVIALVSMFLPFVTASAMGISQSVTLFQAFTNSFDPMIILIILMMVAVVIMQLAKAPQVPSIVLAALSLVFIFIEVGIAGEAFSAASSMGVKVSYDFGFWLMILALIAIIVSSPIYNAIYKRK